MILAIDANNLLHRAYHAIPPMKGPNGTPSNALRGLLTSILNLQDQTRATRIICAFDGGIPLLRQKAAPTYKTNRPPKDEALSIQLKIAESLTHAMGWSTIKEFGTEADDILYTLCLRAKEADIPIGVASGDKDTSQCLEISTDTILMRPPKKTGEPWTTTKPQEVKALLGVHPHQVADFLALTGDYSDNLPGVPGAGPVIITKWMEAYGSLEGVIAHKDELEPKRLREKILPDQLLANHIVTKAYDTGHEIPPPHGPAENLEDALKDLGLYRLLNRLQTRLQNSPEKKAQGTVSLKKFLPKENNQQEFRI